ncbi:MAG: threonine/serine dehydratase [Silicimonas sp.]
MLDPAEIGVAYERIRERIHKTPIILAKDLGLDKPIEVKLENTQLTGSFKVRGAFNNLISREVTEAGVVAASGGNHGAAVAYAAKALGHPARIFVPELAGPSKIALIRRTGAELVVVPGTYAEALSAARVYEDQTGAIQVHAYDDPATVVGQGTMMLEWEAQGLENVDTILIAVGGGGLIGGALLWLQGRRKVVAVEPETCATLYSARAAGRPVDVEVGGIAANALGAKRIGDICFDLASQFDTPVVKVTDEAIATAQRNLWQGLRQWVEPAGAAALAALASRAYVPAKAERVAVLVCGANPAPGPFD